MSSMNGFVNICHLADAAMDALCSLNWQGHSHTLTKRFGQESIVPGRTEGAILTFFILTRRLSYYAVLSGAAGRRTVCRRA